MNLRLVLATGIRIFSIFLFLSSASFIVDIIRAREFIDTQIGAYFVVAVYLIVATLLWMFPLSIAGSFIPKQSSDEKESFNTFDLANVGCALLALYILASNAWALVKVVQFFSQGYMTDPELKATFWAHFVMFIIGGLLFINSKLVARKICQ